MKLFCYYFNCLCARQCLLCKYCTKRVLKLGQLRKRQNVLVVEYSLKDMAVNLPLSSLMAYFSGLSVCPSVQVFGGVISCLPSLPCP